jgi:hypothetical protein
MRLMPPHPRGDLRAVARAETGALASDDALG